MVVEADSVVALKVHKEQTEQLVQVFMVTSLLGSQVAS